MEIDTANCEICKENAFKYKCPACSIKTCSLTCCKAHKQATSCTGQRDKTKFVKLQEFTERELLNDYNFLEEQSRLVDNTQRDVLKRKYDITQTMEYLKGLAYKQSKVNLQFMPRHSTKRLANRTRFDNVTKIINWHVDLRFGLDKVYTVNELCSSKESLKSILCRFYKDNQFTLFLSGQPLHEYQSAFDNVLLNVLYEVRNFTLKCKYYLKFDLNRSLEENLYRKTVIEYPSLNVVLDNDLEKFVVKSEEEILEEVRKVNNSGNSRIEIKKEDKEEGECDDDDDDESKAKRDKPTNSDEEEDDDDDDDDDDFDLDAEFEKLEKGFSEAGIKFEKI